MLEELLEIMMAGGQGQPSQQRKQAANPWLDILEGVLGGNASQSGQQKQAGPDLGDILEIVLGGSGSANRRQQTPIGGNPMLAPFTQALAERLGISPQMASIIISAAFGLLMSRLQSKVQSGQLNAQAGVAGLNMDELLDRNVLASQGVTARVASQTGLSESDIERSLREALEILGVGSGSAPPTKQKAAPAKPKTQPKNSSHGTSDLKHLLDTWKIDG